MHAPRPLRSFPPELLVLSACAFLTRCWQLFVPGERVWDEILLEDYAARYLTGSFYVDVHPPLAKLLFALAAWVGGVSGTELAGGASAPLLRVLPAVAGALLIPTVWLLLRTLGASRTVAAFGAALLLFDNALVVQSRFVLPDMLLLWFIVAATTAWCIARQRAGAARWRWMAGAALLAGAAASTKWTGLSALALIGASWLRDLWRAHDVPVSHRVGEGAVLVVAPVTVYLLAFAAHFVLLPNDGGDVTLMPPRFAATRVGNASYRPDARLSFGAELLDVHRVMLGTNLRWSNTSQPAASKWYTWPISKHRIQYWRSVGETNGVTRRIELQGNPVLWYGVLLVAGLWLALLAMRRVSAGALSDSLGLALTGFAINFVPFAFITRPMYLYHYLPALVFSVVFAALVLGRIAHALEDDGPPWRAGAVWARWLLAGVLGAVVVSFLYFAPLSYGAPLSERALAHRAWLLEGR